MVNGDQTPQIKITFEHKLVRMFWGWWNKTFPHPSKQRYSPTDKEIADKTISWLVRMLGCLCLILLLVGALKVRNVVIENNVPKQQTAIVKKQIEEILLKNNKELDPTYVTALSQTIIDESGPIDPRLMAWIVIAESRGNPNAMGPPVGSKGKRAEGVTQQWPDEKDRRPEYVRYHLIPQIGGAKEKFMAGYLDEGCLRGAFERYIGLSEKTKRSKDPKARATVAEVNRYIAQITVGFLEEMGYWRK